MKSMSVIAWFRQTTIMSEWLVIHHNSTVADSARLRVRRLRTSRYRRLLLRDLVRPDCDALEETCPQGTENLSSGSSLQGESPIRVSTDFQRLLHPGRFSSASGHGSGRDPVLAVLTPSGFLARQPKKDRHGNRHSN